MIYSHLEKDSTPTEAFDLDQPFPQTSFNLVQAMDEFDLQQSCLLRLKVQREKIQELTRLYQENEKQLVARCQKEKEMKEEIQRLTQLQNFKCDWQELKRQFDILSKKYQASQDDLLYVRKELQNMATSSASQSQELQQEIKLLKQQRMLSDSHWESILADKEEQIKKQNRSAQQKQYELCQKIEKLQEKILQLEETLSERKEEIQNKKTEFEVELQVREEDLTGFGKVVESYKKQNNELKAKLIALQDCYAKEKQELHEVIEQLKVQVKILKKDQSDKENQLYQYKEIVKKCDTKNQALESTVTSLKTNLKKFKVNTDSNMKKVASSSEEEKMKLEIYISELKGELEKEVESKMMMANEIKRLKGFIQRKQQQQKQRKLLLMSEFRQIDKMEKMVKKII